MAKMIKYNDEFVGVSELSTMLKRVSRVSPINENSCLVYMEDKDRQKIEVKTPFSAQSVFIDIENQEYEGEIVKHLYSHYIGEL
jgi:hypothetical protein